MTFAEAQAAQMTVERYFKRHRLLRRHVSSISVSAHKSGDCGVKVGFDSREAMEKVPDRVAGIAIERSFDGATVGF